MKLIPKDLILQILEYQIRNTRYGMHNERLTVLKEKIAADDDLKDVVAMVFFEEGSYNSFELRVIDSIINMKIAEY